MTPRSVLVAAGAFLLAGAAAAQDDPDVSIDPDLRCALWAAVAGGEFEQGPERSAYDAVFTYFMGKFEGRTGQRIEDAMLPELFASEAQDWASLTAMCQSRALELGNRLVDFGANLQAFAGEAEAAPPDEKPATSAP